MKTKPATPIVALEVVSLETGEVVKRIDCAGRSPNVVDKAFCGLQRNMNSEEYFVREVTE